MNSEDVRLLPLRSHPFVDIDFEIISLVGCFQVQAKVCAHSTGLSLSQFCRGNRCG